MGPSGPSKNPTTSLNPPTQFQLASWMIPSITFPFIVMKRGGVARPPLLLLFAAWVLPTMPFGTVAAFTCFVQSPVLSLVAVIGETLIARSPNAPRRKYHSIGGWEVGPTGEPFRFFRLCLRACARSVCLVEFDSKRRRLPIPLFPFWPCRHFPFPFLA